jgi:hypothetical protein
MKTPVVLALLTAVAGCTLVYIGGNDNRVNDTGGDVSARLRRSVPTASDAQAASGLHLSNPIKKH